LAVSSSPGVGGNRHRYGHRHTRSEILDQPVIVKSYNPGPTTPRAEAILEEEDPELLKLPSIDSFSFEGILKSVEPEVTRDLDSIQELCANYQETLGGEVDQVTTAQSELDNKMKDTDQLANTVLKTTKARIDRFETERAGFRGGAAVDALADTTETTHTTMTSIISTLLAIDEMLPPQERLSPETSAHRKHYPRLHSLLAGKAAELNLCFGSGKADNSSRTEELTIADENIQDNEGPSDLQKLPMWMRRRQSSSQAVSSPAGLRVGSFPDARRLSSPPYLQLRTILPAPIVDSPKPPDSARGGSFQLPPQTSAGVSLTTPVATPQLQQDPSPDLRPSSSRRGSGIWGRRPSTATLGFFPINEGTDILNSSNGSDEYSSPPTAGGRTSWRGSGSWSSLGGLWGGRSSRGSGIEAAKRERAEEKLKRVLESGESAKKGKAPVW